MALNVNTDVWGEPSDWNISTATGRYFKYPRSRRTWTQLAEAGYQSVNADLDFSIAPWWIPPCAWNQRRLGYWYNNYKKADDSEINDPDDINCAHSEDFLYTNDPTGATPFILSYWSDSGTSAMRNMTTYWAYEIINSSSATTNIGSRFPVANFRYDKIRISPVIMLTEDDPDRVYVNRSITTYNGFPSQSSTTEKPFCVNFGFRIWIDKNGTWTELPFTVEFPVEEQGANIEGYFAGLSGVKILQSPKMYSLSGTHYNNMMFSNNPSDSINTVGFRCGSAPAREFCFGFNNITSSTNAAVHAMEFGEVAGYRLNEKLSTTGGYIFQGSYYTRITDRETWMNRIKEQLAYIGLPMVWAQSDVSTATLENEKLFLPIFDASDAAYTTTGRYATGTAAAALPNAPWQWVYDIELPQGGAFEDAAALSAVRIPPSVKTIGPKAFKGTALQRVRIAADCTYGEESFPEGCVVTRYPDDRYGQLYDSAGRAVLDYDARRIYVLKEVPNNG